MVRQTIRGKKHSRRKVLQKVAATGAVGTLSGVIGRVEATQAANLDFNCPAQEGTIQGDVPIWISEEVDDSLLEIDVYHNGELGGQVESMENMSVGALDMFITGYEMGGTLYERMQAFIAPYMYDDPEHALQAANPEQSDIADEVLTDLREQGNVRILAPVLQGTRRLTVSESPVYEPADLEGRSIRVPPQDIYSETLSAMGADPVDIDFSELPTALSTGSVAGQENPYNIIHSSGIWEHQDYVIETDHMILPMGIYISENSWQSLSDEQKEELNTAVSDIPSRSLEYVQEGIEGIKEELRNEGLEIITPDEGLDREAFANPVREHIRDEFSDWMDIIESINPDY